MDKKGRCLVGDDATSIENLDDIKAWYEEKSQNYFLRWDK